MESSRVWHGRIGPSGEIRTLLRIEKTQVEACCHPLHEERASGSEVSSMTYSFDPNASYIAVETILVGLSSFCRTVFALDTGSTQTGVNKDLLKLLGFDSSNAIRQVPVATVRGQITMDEYRLPAFSALGTDLHDFDVASVDL